MKIRYNLEIEDMAAFNQFCEGISSTVYRQRHKPLNIDLVSWIFVFVAVSLVMGIHYPEVILSCILFSTISILTYYLFNRYFSAKLLHWLYSKGKNKRIFCEHELELAPDSIRATTNSAFNETKITDINCIGITPTHIFIFITNFVNAFVIPKAKVSEGDLDAFITVMKDRIQSSGNSQPILNK